MGCTSSKPSKQEPLHVVSVVFNPAHVERRYQLYLEYRTRMLRTRGVELYTIEASFDGEFRVTNAQGSCARDHHFQVHAKDPLWLKENLVNYVGGILEKSGAENIAWVDGDVEFEQSDWAERAVKAIKTMHVVQLWEAAKFLGPEGEVLENERSFGYFWQNRHSIEPRDFHKAYPHPGFAWGMSMTAWRQLGGLPEFSIVGSGDSHFAYCLIGRPDCSFPEPVRQFISPGYQRAVQGYATRAAEARTALRCNFPSYLSGVSLKHHWHGDWKDRKYVERYACLRRDDGQLYDPTRDLDKCNGVVCLRDRAFASAILKYFRERKEDGMVVKTTHATKRLPGPLSHHQPSRYSPPQPSTQPPNFAQMQRHRHSSNRHHHTGNQHQSNHDDGIYWHDCIDDHHGYGHDNHHGHHDGDHGGCHDVFSASHSAYC